MPSQTASITIPASIQKVGARSFFSCGGLESVFFLNPGEWELGRGAFSQTNPDNTLEEIAMPQDTGSSDTTDVSKATIPNITGDFTYTGHAVKPSFTITYNSKALVDGVDYIVSYKNNTEPGVATVVIEGFGEFSGRIEKTFTIDKLDQNLKIRSKVKTLNAAKLKSKARGVSYITGTSGAEGKLSFKKLSGNKALKVNAKTGKITLAKGAGKGTYKAQIEVSAASTDVYEEATKIVTVCVKVK